MDEFDGARLVSGDTLDLFFWDMSRATFKEHPGFEIAGASALAAGGVALLTTILM